MKIEPWEASKICYIKLGEKGRWATECFNKGVLRFGFSSGTKSIKDFASNGKWESIRDFWISEGHAKQVATSYTNQIKSYFEDDGTTLWITIENGYLYYGFTEGFVNSDLSLKEYDGDSLSSHRLMNKSGWLKVDVNGLELRINELSGNLTKISGFRGTTFTLDKDKDSYLRNRLQGKFNETIYEVQKSIVELKKQLSKLIKTLTPQDFELLIQLIFSNSGWRQIFSTGGTRKTIDLELENPITGELIFVQVKSESSNSQLSDYIRRKEMSYYSKMFYVYHSGEVRKIDDTSVSVWDVDKVSEQVIANGLIDWLLKKSK